MSKFLVSMTLYAYVSTRTKAHLFDLILLCSSINFKSHARDSLTHCWSVRQSVGQSHFAFLALTGGFSVTAPAQMLGQPFIITAPTKPHVASVAVYPVLLVTD